MKLSGPVLLFVGKFLITDLISLLIVGLLRSLISSWVSLGNFCVSRNLSILSNLLAYNYSWIYLVILFLSVSIPSLSFLDLGFCAFFPSPPPPLSLVNGLLILLIFSRMVLVLLILLFFYSLFYLSLLKSIVSFLLLALGLICSSVSSSSRCKVRESIWDLPFNAFAACHKF